MNEIICAVRDLRRFIISFPIIKNIGVIREGIVISCRHVLDTVAIQLPQTTFLRNKWHKDLYIPSSLNVLIIKTTSTTIKF